jgi:hypothetical protein
MRRFAFGPRRVMLSEEGTRPDVDVLLGILGGRSPVMPFGIKPGPRLLAGARGLTKQIGHVAHARADERRECQALLINQAVAISQSAYPRRVLGRVAAGLQRYESGRCPGRVPQPACHGRETRLGKPGYPAHLTLRTLTRPFSVQICPHPPDRRELIRRRSRARVPEGHHE